MYTLLVTKGPDAGLRFPIHGTRVSVGRAPDMSLILTDPTVRPRHFMVIFDAGGWRAITFDPDATVLVDRRWQHPSTQRRGARIFVGATQMLLFAGDIDIDTATIAADGLDVDEETLRDEALTTVGNEAFAFRHDMQGKATRVRDEYGRPVASAERASGGGDAEPIDHRRALLDASSAPTIAIDLPTRGRAPATALREEVENDSVITLDRRPDADARSVPDTTRLDDSALRDGTDAPTHDDLRARRDAALPGLAAIVGASPLLQARPPEPDPAARAIANLPTVLGAPPHPASAGAPIVVATPANPVPASLAPMGSAPPPGAVAPLNSAQAGQTSLGSPGPAVPSPPPSGGELEPRRNAWNVVPSRVGPPAQPPPPGAPTGPVAMSSGAMGSSPPGMGASGGATPTGPGAALALAHAAPPPGPVNRAIEIRISDTAIAALPSRSRDLEVLYRKDGPFSAELRILGTRMEELRTSFGYKSFLFTSAGEGDGKTVTAANLALVMSEDSSRRIALVDANFRAPRQGALFNLEEGRGILAALSGKRSLGECVARVVGRSLIVLSAGGQHPNPSQVLTDPKFRTVLQELAQAVDFLIIDAPAAIPHADVPLLLALADAAFVVVAAGQTRRSALDRAVEALGPSRVVGAVLRQRS